MLLSTGTTPAPSATSLAATDVTATTATLHGNINPSGGSADARFEYSIDPNFVGAVSTHARPALNRAGR